MRRAIALALVAVLALAAPAQAAKAKPPKDDEGFPIFALAPCGFAAGYLLAGRPERALIAPLGVYVATGAGGVIGLMNAWEKSSINKPLESFLSMLTGPLGGMAIGFGLSGGIVLIDQATSAPPIGPWLAPLASVGAIGAILGAGTIQDKLRSDQTLTSP